MALAKGIQLARRVAIGAQFHRAKSIPVYSNLRIRWCSLHGPRYDQMRIRNVLPSSRAASPGLHGRAKLVRLTATLLLDRPASPVLLELRTILCQGYLDPARWHCRLGSQTRSRRPLRFAYGHAAVAPERGGMPCLTRSSMSANLPAMLRVIVGFCFAGIGLVVLSPAAQATVPLIAVTEAPENTGAPGYTGSRLLGLDIRSTVEATLKERGARVVPSSKLGGDLAYCLMKACVRQIGATTGATHVLFVEAPDVEHGYYVRFRVLDAKTGEHVHDHRVIGNRKVFTEDNFAKALHDQTDQLWSEFQAEEALLPARSVPAPPTSVAVMSTDTPVALTKQEMDEATEAVRRGVDLLAKKDYEGAHHAFLEARDISPTPMITAQLGFADMGMGRWVDAKMELSDALAKSSDSWVMQHQDQLRSSVDTAQKHVGLLRVQGAPEEAEISFRGEMIGILPMNRTFSVTAGPGTVKVRMPGFEPAQESVNIVAGERTDLSVALKPKVFKISSTAGSSR